MSSEDTLDISDIKLPPRSADATGLVPNRTVRTEKAYLEEAARIVALTKEHFRIDDNDPDTTPFAPSDLVGWFRDTRSVYRYNNWKRYRASMCYQLELWVEDANRSPEWRAESAKTISELKELRWQDDPENLGKTIAQRSRELPPRTGSHKRKSIAPQFLARLILDMEDAESDWERRAIKMAIATIHAGLRPREWITARINEDVLTIENAKATNGRGTGVYRQIRLEAIEAVDNIAEHLAYINEWVLTKTNVERHQLTDEEAQDLGREYNDLCGHALRRAQVRIFGKNLGITPYSFRHQFSANIKASGHSKAEVAALMGQASIETAGAHYGKGRHGHNNLSPEQAKTIPSTAVSTPGNAETAQPNPSADQAPA